MGKDDETENVVLVDDETPETPETSASLVDRL
jgi:hypothetical protein